MVATPTSPVGQFFRRRYSLSVVEGCLLVNERVAVPVCLQQRVLHQLHAGHPGIFRMKELARSHVNWLGLNKESFAPINSRAAAAKAPVKTTLSLWPLVSALHRLRWTI
jgi:hypothetical protein